MIINVSHNEIVILCQKAFDGLQRHYGESDIIANMIADLEMVGLNGVKHFARALDFIKSEKDIPVQIDLSSADQIVANLHSNSILCHLPPLIDYALEKALKQNTVTLIMEQCHNRWLVFSELAKLTRNGLSVKATWNNGSYPKHVVFIAHAGCELPELYISNENIVVDALAVNSKNSLHSIVIEISHTPLHPSHPYTQHITAHSLKDARQKAWQHGIQVNECYWNAIKQTAKSILVASNETSRLGAGEHLVVHQ